MRSELDHPSAVSRRGTAVFVGAVASVLVAFGAAGFEVAWSGRATAGDSRQARAVALRHTEVVAERHAFVIARRRGYLNGVSAGRSAGRRNGRAAAEAGRP